VKLAGLVPAGAVVIPLRSGVLQEAALALAEALAKTSCVADPEKLRRQLEEKLPPEFVTAAGGVFLVHFRTDAMRKLAVAIGVAPHPVARDKESGKEARVVMMIVAPPKDAALYLRAVSALASLASRPEAVEAMTSAADAEALLSSSPLKDAVLPDELMVRDFMIPKVISVRADAKLREAARLIMEHNVPSLPVVSDSGELLGMVSHRELLRVMLPTYVKRMSSGEWLASSLRGRAAEDPLDLPVREVMDRSVLCISEGQTLADVASLMATKEIDRFPVVRDGILVGFITRGDIVRRIFGP
jgi:CBS domain-containing protein